MQPLAVVAGLAILGHLAKRSRVGGAAAPAVAVVIPAETQAILRAGRTHRQRGEVLSGEEMAHLYVEKAVRLAILEAWQQRASDDYDRYATAYKEGPVSMPAPGQTRRVLVVDEKTLEKKSALYRERQDAVADAWASLENLRETLLDTYGDLAYDLVHRMLLDLQASLARGVATAEQFPGHVEWGNVPLQGAIQEALAALEDDAASWREEEA